MREKPMQMRLISLILCFTSLAQGAGTDYCKKYLAMAVGNEPIGLARLFTEVPNESDRSRATYLANGDQRVAIISRSLYEEDKFKEVVALELTRDSDGQVPLYHVSKNQGPSRPTPASRFFNRIRNFVSDNFLEISGVTILVGWTARLFLGDSIPDLVESTYWQLFAWWTTAVVTTRYIKFAIRKGEDFKLMKAGEELWDEYLYNRWDQTHRVWTGESTPSEKKPDSDSHTQVNLNEGFPFASEHRAHRLWNDLYRARWGMFWGHVLIPQLLRMEGLFLPHGNGHFEFANDYLGASTPGLILAGVTIGIPKFVHWLDEGARLRELDNNLAQHAEQQATQLPRRLSTTQSMILVVDDEFKTPVVQGFRKNGWSEPD